MIDKLFYFAQECAPSRGRIIGAQCLPQTPATDDTLQTIFMVVFINIGAVAVLLIVIAGLRYIMARDDPAKITAAKNDIKYVLIGLVIAGMAAVVVNYVIGKF